MELKEKRQEDSQLLTVRSRSLRKYGSIQRYGSNSSDDGFSSDDIDKAIQSSIQESHTPPQTPESKTYKFSSRKRIHRAEPPSAKRKRRTPTNVDEKKAGEPLDSGRQKCSAHTQSSKYSSSKSEPSAVDVAYLTPREETVKDIARAHNVDVQDILRLNRGRMSGLRATSMLLPGTNVMLPAGANHPQPPDSGACAAQETSPSKVASTRSLRRPHHVSSPPPTPPQHRVNNRQVALTRRATTTPSPVSKQLCSSHGAKSTVELPASANRISSEQQNPVASLSVHEAAKLALSRSSDPTEVVCRDQERSKILEFIGDHVASKTAGSLYISGKPGTGKTATINRIVSDMRAGTATGFGLDGRCVKVVEANCMTANEPTQIYKQILVGVAGSFALHESVSNQKALQLLDERYLVQRSSASNGSMVVVVLDEIDQLETRDKAVLYKVFSWTQLPNSAVILIGIANGLDLTQRVLPMLKGRGLSPQLLNYLPYTKQQLVDIISARLRHVGVTASNKPVLEKNAVDFCAAKVTSFNGDLRNCLDVCRRTVELSAPGGSGTSATPPGTSAPSPRQIPIMMKLFKDMQGSDAARHMRVLPRQQKLVLCVLYRTHIEDQSITVADLHNEYVKICAKSDMPVEHDFSKMLILMDCTGLIEVTGKRTKSAEFRQSKVRLRGLRDDIRFAFTGDTMLSEMLKDNA